MKNSLFGILFLFGMSVPSAYAQSLTLHSGDRVTVDSTGTHGIISGHRVNTKITSYTSSGNGRGVDKDAVQINGTARFTLGSGGTITGGPNGIAMEALDSSQVSITGGAILCQKPDAAMPTSNGTALSVGGKSQAIIIGGTLTGGQYGPALAVEDGGAVLVRGGRFAGQYGPALAPEGSGTITVTGGTFSTTHGAVGMLTGGSAGKIDLFSNNGPFFVKGFALNHTSLAPNSSGTISGVLANGQPLHTTFLNGGQIRLNLASGRGFASSPRPGEKNH